MAEKSKIEWTDSTFNPWEGCTKVGPGCDHCYAENRNARFAGGQAINWGAGAPRRRTSKPNWNKPALWNKQPFYQCDGCGWRGHEPQTKGALFDRLASCPNCDDMNLSTTRRRVFCASLADVFDNEVDPQWRLELFDLIEQTPNLDWLMLTKRIGNVSRMLPERWRRVLPPNVWLGITVVNQEEADRDIPKLLTLNATVRFLSMEPLLGSVDLSKWLDLVEREPGNWVRRNIGQLDDMLDWVIVGGETGSGARPLHPDWAYDIKSQCESANVPFLFKQWGDWANPGTEGFGVHEGHVEHIRSDGTFWGDQLPHDEDADVLTVVRLGKHLTGRRLGGETWDGYPVRMHKEMSNE